MTLLVTFRSQKTPEQVFGVLAVAVVQGRLCIRGINGDTAMCMAGDVLKIEVLDL